MFKFNQSLSNRESHPPAHMTDCLCCGQLDVAGLFMAIRINPAARRVCNTCAEAHGLKLPRNSELLDAYNRGNQPARWMRQCLPSDLGELRMMMALAATARQDRAEQNAIHADARRYRADLERERVLVGRRQRQHDAVGPGWLPDHHHGRCMDWRAAHIRAGQDADTYAIGDAFHCKCCATAWTVQNGYADAARFEWKLCKWCE